MTLQQTKQDDKGVFQARAIKHRDIVVSLDGVRKKYRSPAHLAVDALSLQVYKGEILTLLGPSGCGKTTLLRLIAGFEHPDTGTITIANNVVSGANAWVKPEKRHVGFVFQDYALFPHLTVLDNVMFGLHDGKRQGRKKRALQVLELVGLGDLSKRHPHQLSGGQQQRVALARALAPEPAVMLLDEPFSNLDAALREQTRAEVRHILKAAHTTAILVTHDQEEALTFADRIAVMQAGRLEQVDTPEQTYLKPKTEFVATFLGTANILSAEANGENAHCLLGNLALTQPASGNVMISIRPEDISLTPVKIEEEDASVQARVITRQFKGHDLTYLCELCNLANSTESPYCITVQTGPHKQVQEGDLVTLSVKAPAVVLAAKQQE